MNPGDQRRKKPMASFISPVRKAVLVAGAVGCSLAVTACGSTTSSSANGGTVDSMLPAPQEQFIPTPTSTCPEFVDGTVTVTPNGKARDVVLYMDPVAAAAKDGPFIFYWHGTGSSPVVEPPVGLGADTLQAIRDMGGVVAAPFHDAAAGQWPWFLVQGTQDDDLYVADEILACAIQKIGIDKRRIYSIGMSAGGLMTGVMSYRRSGYLASVVTYSGGSLGTREDQDPTNLFAAMSFYGGPNDMVVINFQQQTLAYQQKLRDRGDFAFACNHGRGHSIPTDAVGSVWQFFQDHSFGTSPEPYAAALPDGFPSYCSLAATN